MSLTIKTNNVPRDLVCGYDLTQKERAEFDYIDDDEIIECEFLRYRGAVYDMRDFVCIIARSKFHGGYARPVDDDSPLLAWHGILTDSYFSGVVIRYSEDFERVTVGTVYS